MTGPYWISGPLPETPEPDVAPPDWAPNRVVGEPLPRVDGYDRVSGTAVYPSDVTLPDMLYGFVVRCPHANARVKRIDVSRAVAMPGVRAVLTGESPGADLDWYYSRTVSTKVFERTCRFEGEAVAAVAAETPDQAADAARAVLVEWEVLPFVHDETHALDAGAAPVHPDGNRVSPPQTYERGDVAAGFAAAEAVIEVKLATATELQTPMELHGCVARWDRNRLTLWASTQGVYGVQQRVASVLRMPLADLRVIGHYVGGGFGAKLSGEKEHVIAALLARAAARPVKLFASREESMLCSGNRPPSHVTVRLGAKRDGTLTAIDFRGLGTGGAYPSGGTSLLDWLARDLYTCPNVRCETEDVYINAGPARPFRAPGHPQGAWALEQAMDELAAKLAMDPVALRLKNVPEISQARGNLPYSTTGLAECLREGAREFGWTASRAKPAGTGAIRRGVGVAACEWIAGAGGPPATILVKVFPDGSANLNMGASDIGTGTKTVMAMVVSEELGIPVDRIRIENADTGTTQFATPSGGSKTVPTESPAVRAAALDARRQLLEMAAEEHKADPATLRWEDGVVVIPGDPPKRVAITDIQGIGRRGLVVGIGYRAKNPEDLVTCPFSAHFCEVEVDTRTGEVKIVRFVAAHDSGRVLNRRTYENQVRGGVTMGIGLAMTERRVLDRQTGKLVNRNWHDYKLPTAMDVPAEITCVPIDRPDPRANSTGVKGLGEPATIPAAAAVANAIYAATGRRLTASPGTPVELLASAAGREG